MVRYSSFFGRKDSYLSSDISCRYSVVVMSVLATVLFVIVQMTGIVSSVIDGYYPYADAMFHGIVPYSQDIVYYETGVPVMKGWEYPPLAYLFIALPHIIGWTPATYQAAFIAMTVAFFIIGMWAIIRISNALGHDEIRNLIMYSVSMMLIAEFIFDRFDIISAVMVLVALMFLIEGKNTPAFIMLSLAMMVKLYPSILFPIFILYIVRRTGFREAFKGFVTFTLTALACLAVIVAMGANPLSFIGYHSGRLLEIESFPASILEMLSLVNLADISVVFSSGSDNITGPLADKLAGIMSPILVLGEIALYVVYMYLVYRSPTVDNNRLFSFCFLSVCIFLCLSSVLSGQYVIWLIPLFVLTLSGSDSKEFVVNGSVLFLVIIMTQLDFMINFGFRGVGEALSVLGIFTIFLRNAALVVLMVPSISNIVKELYQKRSS